MPPHPPAPARPPRLCPTNPPPCPRDVSLSTWRMPLPQAKTSLGSLLPQAEDQAFFLVFTVHSLNPFPPLLLQPSELGGVPKLGECALP